MNIKVPIEDLSNLLKSNVDTMRKYIPIVAEHTKVCKKCETEFISNHKLREFCSKKCMSAAASQYYRDRKLKR